MAVHHDNSSNVAPLLSSLAEFTGQREQDALSASLGHAIRDLTEAGSVTLYKLLLSGDQPTLVAVAMWRAEGTHAPKEGLPPPALLADHPDFEVCISTQQIQRRPNPKGEGRLDLIMPLNGKKDRVEMFFLVEDICADEATHRVLPLLIEIYRNFLALLRDNQHDPLTGLLNRKTFDTHIGGILTRLNAPGNRRADSGHGSYCLAIVDIDFFKRINDNFGHLYGDEVLLLLASMMQDNFREDDALFRFGGEEFVILLRDVSLAQATQALERFRRAVEAREFPQVGRVTLSSGLTQIRPNELPPQIIDRADRALYFAKGNGRNQVGVYETLVAQGKLDTPELGTGEIELF